MIGAILILIGCSFLIIWGIAHIIPTKKVIGGFGDVSDDNRITIMMTWVAEGFTMIFLGGLIILILILGDATNTSGRISIWTSVIFLSLLALWHLFTGARTKVIPMKICPFIIGTSTLLISSGSILGP